MRGKDSYLMQWLAFISLLLNCAGTQAVESLTYDPETGIYTMEYYNTYDQSEPVQRRVQFELRTRIDPAVSSKINDTGADALIYRYELKNGPLSKQRIGVIRLDVTHAYKDKLLTPNGWSGGIVPKFITAEIVASWSPLPEQQGLKPGSTQPGFGFESRDIPGIGIFEAIGRARRDLGGFPDLGPSADTSVGKQFSELMKANESVRRFAAAPRIVVPDPFNVATVLTGIQQHIRDDLSRYELVDAVFASQLDRYIQAAIAAANQGNNAAVIANLKDLRQMLKKEYVDVDQDSFTESEPEKVKNRQVLIDKLAAKVLDFDFKYVEKRVKAN